MVLVLCRGYGLEEQERKPPPKRGGGKRRWAWAPLEPRRAGWWAREWDRAYLLACAAGLMVDPLFLYAVSVSGPLMCVFLDGWFAAAVTVLRCTVDAMHAWNLLMRLRAAVRPPEEDDGADEEVAAERGAGGNGGGPAPAQVARPVSRKGLMLDMFVILPVMQVIVWVAAPAMIRAGSTTAVMTVLLVSFLFEYLPKIYHAVRLLRRMQNTYVFGTIWRLARAGYLLGAQRATKCLKDICAQGGNGCAPGALACAAPLYYGGAVGGVGADRLAWALDASARGTCLDSGDNYQYGAYNWTVMLVANPSRLEKILLPIFWGLMTLSTFGNLASTTEWLEIVFNIITITGGLILVTMLIGNIKVFLNAATSKKQAMQTRLRGVEWWMKRKKLPQSFRHRVRQHERQRWAATRGVDECRIVRDLPEGLRRDIKYHLCLDLVRQVPLFQHMDDLVLENICDRVKSLVFPKGEIRGRPGAEDAVHSARAPAEQPGAEDRRHELLHAGAGQLQRGRAAVVVHAAAVPGAAAGVVVDAGDDGEHGGVRAGGRGRLVRDAALPLHLHQRQGAAQRALLLARVAPRGRPVAVQLAWRRYKHRKTLASLSFIRPRRPLSRCSSLGEEKLRLYTAILTSPKPNPNQDDLV
ncbi:hypothetical protein OsJ_03689 [Oryza sativa Japonica Group]|uniref:Ion transport domain-containing protein n=1 Tax=Oryza sativa subsp. japonica TaxID=39947 RepID=B9ETD1_ORYSJ|nr:hypothetical protein OsJ_03689 [Oryza sativa Japonica Group]